MFSNNSSNKGNPYLRFLQLAKAIQNLPDAPLLDANENALLEAIALRWFEQKPMTVREAIGLSNLGSPATLHNPVAVSIDSSAKFRIPFLATFRSIGHRTKPSVDLIFSKQALHQV